MTPTTCVQKNLIVPACCQVTPAARSRPRCRSPEIRKARKINVYRATSVPFGSPRSFVMKVARPVSFSRRCWCQKTLRGTDTFGQPFKISSSIEGVLTPRIAASCRLLTASRRLATKIPPRLGLAQQRQKQEHLVNMHHTVTTHPEDERAYSSDNHLLAGKLAEAL